MLEWVRTYFPPPLWAYAAGGWAMIAELADCANAGRLVVALLIGPRDPLLAAVRVDVRAGEPARSPS
jgi:hypothetical protein